MEFLRQKFIFNDFSTLSGKGNFYFRNLHYRIAVYFSFTFIQESQDKFLSENGYKNRCIHCYDFNKSLNMSCNLIQSNKLKELVILWQEIMYEIINRKTGNKNYCRKDSMLHSVKLFSQSLDWMYTNAYKRYCYSF